MKEENRVRSSFRLPDSRRPDLYAGVRNITRIEPIHGNCNQIIDGEYCGNPFTSTSRNRKKCDEHMQKKF